MLLVLGGNMKVTKTGPSGLHLTAVYGTVIARLVVLPFTGLGLLKLFSAMGIMPEDPLLRFVIVLQVCANAYFVSVITEAKHRREVHIAMKSDPTVCELSQCSRPHPTLPV